MNDITIGIDLSLRNTAIVILDSSYSLIDFCIVSNNTLSNEALLSYNSSTIVDFIFANTWSHNNDPVKSQEFLLKDIVIEELSFNSLSAMSDLIAANKWILRTKIIEKFPMIAVKQVSVKEWRCTVISKEEQKTINDRYPIIKAKRGEKLLKNVQKINNANKAKIKKETKALTVSKLPEDIKKIFENYIVKNKFKTDSIFDLADAYWITTYFINSDRK